MHKTAYSPLYNNDVTSEYLRGLDRSPFSEEALTTFSPAALVQVRESEAYKRAHPVTGVFRAAAEGSHTRDGGVIVKGTLGVQFRLADGSEVAGARVGDCAVYPDGTMAGVVTGAGKANSQMALVGSRLSNGDEIIDTPQGSLLLLQRKDVAWPDDFLPDVRIEA
jgi:hypothetical protein